MADPTQATRHIGVETPLGADKLLLRGYTGQEALSQLFEFELDLLSEDDAINFDDIVGKNITVRQDLGGGGKRYLNGFVRSFVQTESMGDQFAQYRAIVVPWLWFLTRTTDCRIFQQKTVPDIIKQVFGDLGFSDFEERLSGGYRTWNYCVQYRESDFNFVSRLMEQEGIYYYFSHAQGSHKLVLCDSLSKHDTFDEYDEVDFDPRAIGSSVMERITDWTLEKSVCTGKYAQTDYDFTKPRTSLMTTAEDVKSCGNADYENYNYPGEYGEMGDGDHYTGVRMDEKAQPHEMCYGDAQARGICPGYKFTLKGYPRDDQNREYLVESARYNSVTAGYETGPDTVDDSFRCSFAVLPAGVQFRAPRTARKPQIRGGQTAVVVGPAGEEIYTDEHSRIKVQFHWDREGKNDENSSCWIRVAQGSAGKQWGTVFIPRIGQEVLVTFLEGDPDQPLVTGVVYNAVQKPHYSLPDEKTKSYIKTNSSPGGDGYNELRFEDKAGKEQIFIHAERNMDERVKNDSMERILKDRHLIVGDEGDQGKVGDQREKVFVDKHLTVNKNHTEHIGGDMKLLVGGIDGAGKLEIVAKDVKKELLEKDSHLHVKGNRNTKVDLYDSLEVAMEQNVKVGLNHRLKALAIDIKADTAINLEAGVALTLKCGGSSISLTPAAIFIQGGPIVNINTGAGPSGAADPQVTAPEDAEEASPTAPTEADTSTTGQKSAYD